jgi:nucleoside-diphosphate-sugar epimerase
VIPNFISALLDGRAPVIFGDGEQSRDFTYVDNVVRANLLAMGAEELPARVYNVACGESVTLNQLVAELRDLLDSDVEPSYRDPRPGDVRHSVADISAARRDLGYEPAVLLRDGLGRTIDFFRDQLSARRASTPA